jgi:hypothetical protein
MTTPEFDIAILLPTRGRSDSLERSVKSVIELAADPAKVQIMFGFDNDDDVGTQYFVDELQPWLDEHNVNYTAMTFNPLGYIRLNEYVMNWLATAMLVGWCSGTTMPSWKQVPGIKRL